MRELEAKATWVLGSKVMLVRSFDTAIAYHFGLTCLHKNPFKFITTTTRSLMVLRIHVFSTETTDDAKVLRECTI